MSAVSAFSIDAGGLLGEIAERWRRGERRGASYVEAYHALIGWAFS
jgi:hypothetical protein